MLVNWWSFQSWGEQLIFPFPPPPLSPRGRTKPHCPTTPSEQGLQEGAGSERVGFGVCRVADAGTPADYALLDRLLRWPWDQLFPALDLARLAALNPAGASALASSGAQQIPGSSHHHRALQSHSV